MSITRALLTGCLLLAASGAHASPALDATATCLTDHTNGADRKLLARWVFLAMAQHPAIAQLSKATEADNQAAHKQMGELFTRLISEDCPTEIKAMVASDGMDSFEKAFEMLGSMAMQELIADPHVSGAFSGLQQYVDEEKIQGVLQNAK